MNTADPATKRLAFGRAALAALPVAAIASLGAAVTRPNIPGWYAGLAKPPFTPPNGVFAPVWTVLFAAMAYAVYRVLSLPAGTPGKAGAVALFFVQLVLNAAWSWVFFGAHSPALAALDIGLLLAAILATIDRFSHLDRAAAWLLAPYAAWVGYATYLNLAIWWLNG